MTAASHNPPVNPPRPPFSLSIGVVGHRPDRLPKPGQAAYGRIEAEVAHVLSELSREARRVCDSNYDFFAPESQSKLTLSLVTALAEGADTIVTKAAIERGYDIDAVLPFEADNYGLDFEGAARDDFKSLYGRARAKLVLVGRRKLPPHKDDPNADKAYEAAGLTVIGNCDVVLAIWDGGGARGRGGTTEMLTAAAGLGIPIIHIDAADLDADDAKPTCVMWSGLDKFPVQADKLDGISVAAFDTAVPRLMDELARPPDSAIERHGLRRHFKQRLRFFNPGLAFPLLLMSLWVRLALPTDLVPKGTKALADKFCCLLKPVGGNGSPPASLLAPYAWTDAVGIYFAQVFRSAFVLNFAFASFAVAAALISLLKPTETVWPAALEIVLILVVVANTLVGRCFGWHSRWLESREVAERLRVAAMLWVLGMRPRAFAGEEPAWTGWYTRAFVRVEPLRSCTFDRPEVDRARAAIINILQDQCKYHETTAGRMKRLEHRLELVGLVLFISTVLVAIDHFCFKGANLECAVHQILHDWWPAHPIGIGLSALLPAFATATYGIRVIGDFEGIAKRSERAHRSLSGHIAALRQDPPDLEILRRRARAAGDAMLGDVSSWRLAVESRELAIPG